MRRLHRLLVCFSLPAVALAQSLHVPLSTTDRKTPGVLSLILDAPPGKAPSAMQWEISVPPAIVIGKGDISIGKAAEMARKTLTCAVSANKAAAPQGVRYLCILAGGQDPIGSGTIAMVRYRAQADVQGAPIRVAIEKILGVSADLKRIEIPNAYAIINIR